VAETYARAGVDIAAGEEAVERIKSKVRATFRPEVLGDIGGFGGMFALDHGRFRHPVLVSSTDTVGTKALVASRTGRYDTIGIDLVAMVVDDIWCFVGSANWDMRSFRLNFELNVEIIDADLAAHLDRFMRGKMEARLSREDLAARGLPLRLRDAGVRLLLPYL